MNPAKPTAATAPGPADSPPAAAPPHHRPGQAITGLERECLRQAIHDLRGPLNNGVLLLDVVRVLAQKDPALVGTKLAQVVQELQRAARMLDHLVGTGDSVATELGPLDLAAAVKAAVGSRPAARGVAIDLDALHEPLWVLSCPDRLAQALRALLERCVAAIPDGGAIRFAPMQRSEGARLVVNVTGQRLLPPRHGIHLTDGSEPASSWFPVMALIRGMRGHLEVAKRDDLVLQVVIDLPNHARHNP